MIRTTLASRIARPLGLACAGCLLPLAALAALPQVRFTPLHADGIYRLGQTVGWTVTVPAGAPDPRGRFAYTIKRNDLDVVKTGSFSLASGRATLALRFDAPGMLYVTVDYEPTPAALSRAQYRTLNRGLKALLSKDDPPLQRLFARYPHYQPLAPQFPFGAFAEHRVATLGAAVAPTLLRPSLPPPRDFNAFWAHQLAALRRVPMRVKLTPIATAQAGVKLFRVRLKSLGSHVRGYLAMPAHAGRFPAQGVRRCRCSRAPAAAQRPAEQPASGGTS